MSGDRPIIGVDFSGARSDSATWVTQGWLRSDRLELESCSAMARSELSDLLVSSPASAVAALDFPFSVPQQFVAAWQPEAAAMPELWQAASLPDIDSESGPDTGPDTGPDNEKNGPLLLESMPGAALRAFGLPFKGYKNGSNAAALRNRILDGLESGSGVAVANLNVFRQTCLESHDCLDSLAAAVTAVLWCRDPGVFRRPGNNILGEMLDTVRSRRASPLALEWSELQAACLEGWLYAPVFLRHHRR